MQVIVPIDPMIRLKMSRRVSHQPMTSQIDVKGFFRLASDEDLSHCKALVGIGDSRSVNVCGELALYGEAI